jgi:hypothetical protein
VRLKLLGYPPAHSWFHAPRGTPRPPQWACAAVSGTREVAVSCCRHGAGLMLPLAPGTPAAHFRECSVYLRQRTMRATAPPRSASRLAYPMRLSSAAARPGAAAFRLWLVTGRSARSPSGRPPLRASPPRRRAAAACRARASVALAWAAQLRLVQTRRPPPGAAAVRPGVPPPFRSRLGLLCGPRFRLARPLGRFSVALARLPPAPPWSAARVTARRWLACRCVPLPCPRPRRRR